MMKKVFFIVSLLFSFYTSFAQPVVNRSPITVTVADARTKTFLNFVLPTYTDTTSNVGGASYQNNIGIDSCGALIFTYSNNAMWIRLCNPKRWGFIGNISGTDTIWVRFPLGVDTTSVPGRQIIFIRAGNGLVSGGIVTKNACRTIDVTPAIYNINYRQYTTAAVFGLAIAAADIFDRIDRVVVDTFGLVSVLQGTSSGIAPQINPSSQISLVEIPIAASSTCLAITQDIIYDQDSTGEWTHTTAGTLSAAFANTDNPYHLTKALFVATYTNGSQIIFTHTGLQDTVSAGEIAKGYLYLNNILLNTIQWQFFYNTTAVSNNLVINPFINTLDTGQYQQLDIPFSAFTFSSSIFNKIVVTFAGADISGAGGLYLDWLQLQKGVSNFTPNYFVDSTKIIAGNEYYYKQGIPYLAGAVGGGGVSADTSFTSNLLIYTNTLTPTGILANVAAFRTALIGTPGDNNDSVTINAFRIVDGYGTGEVGLIEISISRLMIIPEGLFRNNTEITGYEDLGSLLSAGSEIRQGAFKNSTLKFFSAPFFGDISSSNVGDSAFYNCNALNYVYLPAWEAADNTTIFQSCDILAGITVQTSGTSVTSIGTTNGFSPYILANVAGSTNLNIGSGYRWAVPGTNNIKTVFGSNTIGIDSTSNANALTLKADTSVLATQYDISNIPTVTPAALTKTDDTNVTLTLGGTPTTALLQATSLTLGWTGNLAATRGGTGTATVTTGDLLYGSGTDTWSKLGIGTTGQHLQIVGGLPVWRDSTAQWNLLGNSITAYTNFLGTTNNTSLNFRSNNIRYMQLDSLGGLNIFPGATPKSVLTFYRNSSTATKCIWWDIVGDEPVLTSNNAELIIKTNHNAGSQLENFRFTRNAVAATMAALPQATVTGMLQAKVATPSGTEMSYGLQVYNTNSSIKRYSLGIDNANDAVFGLGNVGFRIFQDNGTAAITGDYLRVFAISGNTMIKNKGTYTEIPSSRFTVNSTSQGFLPPRMTTAQRTGMPGAIITLTGASASGSGYTNGTYNAVALTGGTGTGATANIIVSAGVVSYFFIVDGGINYVNGDALSCASIGAGSGFLRTVATANGDLIGALAEGLEVYDLTTHQPYTYNGTTWNPSGGNAGQTVLVSGTKAITITGVSTSSKAFVTLVSPSGVTLTTQYQAVCTANTLTIQANVAAGTINTADGSTINYFVIN